MNWTQDQIKSFAPDAASVAAGQKLAKPGNWETTGESENALWGECKGSGKNPYQIRIDQREFAYRCTCPSRKLPCKHVLGLLFLAANNPGAVAKKDEPDWIAEWLNSRDDRAQKKKEKAEAPPKPVDEKAQAKRAQQRQGRVDAGMEQLAVWLNDLARTGIAQLERKPRDFWEEQSKRLVDAQAPALAARIQALADIPGASQNWMEQLVEELGKIALLVQAYKKLETFPDDFQSEIRQAVGWTVNQDELAGTGERITDRWAMLGQSCEQSVSSKQNIQTQRNWYYGIQSKRFLLSLQFAVGSQGFAEIHVPGSVSEGTAVFWPGTGKLRGRFLERTNELSSGKDAIPWPRQTIPEFLDFVAEQTAKNPWSNHVPASIGDVYVFQDEKRCGIHDAEGLFLPFSRNDSWNLYAISGGHPLNVFGEWNGRTLTPLAVWNRDRFWNFAIMNNE